MLNLLSTGVRLKSVPVTTAAKKTRDLFPQKDAATDHEHLVPWVLRNITLSTRII